MTPVLVTGGAGYIGSHMCKLLSQQGYSVIVLDNLSTGHRGMVKYGQLVEGSVHDTKLLQQIFQQHQVDCVFHFAAFSQVAESLEKPVQYRQNNTKGTRNLLTAMQSAGVDKLVFSSTAAVYGNPLETHSQLSEDSPLNPINPYGESKLAAEQLIKQASDEAKQQAGKKSIRAIALRYFNACGADPDGELGEWHEPETHLIPLAIQAALGQRSAIKVYGNDYPTEDGTCIRDYVHVTDLCAAHLQAYQRLSKQDQAGFEVFNLGNGAGHSVKEVVTAVARHAEKHGYRLPIEDASRREGDPAILVADIARAKHVLSWQPRLISIDTMIAHAWRFLESQAQNND